jgi:hypothetical protein
MKFSGIAARAALIAAATFFLAVEPAAAKIAEPNPGENPILAEYIKQGAHVYFMGAHGGLNGWFIIKDNQIQMGYSTADNKNIVMGVLFDEKGQNYSAAQFDELSKNNKDVSAFLNNLNVGATLNNMPPGMRPPPLPPLPPSLTTLATVSPSQQTPAEPAPLSPGEKLMRDLDQAAGVNIGAASAPKLLMVMDPNCPHCQATWRVLRDAVFKNNLQVRLIPIGQNDEDERAAARLLQTPDPLSAWDKYVGGDKSQLAGVADPIRVGAVRINHILIDDWHITMTPYLVYHGKDGQVKIVQGEPEQVAALLADLTP